MAKTPEPRRDWIVTVTEHCEHCKQLKSNVIKRSQYVYSQSKRVEQTSCEPCFVAACRPTEKPEVTNEPDSDPDPYDLGYY